MQFLLISHLLRDGCINKFGCVDAQFVKKAAADDVGLTIRLPLRPRCCKDCHVAMMIVVYQMVVLASGSGGGYVVVVVCYPSSVVLLMMYLTVMLPLELIPARAVWWLLLDDTTNESELCATLWPRFIQSRRWDICWIEVHSESSRRCQHRCQK